MSEQNSCVTPANSDFSSVLSRLTIGQWVVLSAAVVLTILLRVVEWRITNFSSVIALTLLCGSVTRHRALVLLPLAVRLLTDMLVHLKTGYGFFPSWPFDYSAYLLIFLLGRFVPANRYGIVVAGSVVSVIMYFVLSNLGVWFLWSDTYPRTAAGLVDCFVKAIPFARGTIYGNLLIAPIFFVAWNVVTAPVNQMHSEAATVSTESA